MEKQYISHYQNLYVFDDKSTNVAVHSDFVEAKLKKAVNKKDIKLVPRYTRHDNHPEMWDKAELLCIIQQCEFNPGRRKFVDKTKRIKLITKLLQKVRISNKGENDGKD